MQRNEALALHPYKLWQGKNGRWYTYLPDSEGGRTLKKRTSKDDIEKLIFEHWKKQTEAPTVKDIFEEWLASKLDTGEISKSTYDRYTVTELDIEEFLLKSIAEYSLTAKAFSNLRTLVFCCYSKRECVSENWCISKIIPQNTQDLRQYSA